MAYSYPAIIASLFPLFYILILRLLILVFFPTYQPDINSPVIISYSKTGVYWKGQDKGYKPSRNEKRYSIIILVISIIYMFITLYLAFGILVMMDNVHTKVFAIEQGRRAQENRE